jgi:hypothetical protein
LAAADLEDYPNPFNSSEKEKHPGEFIGSLDFKSTENWSLMKSRMRNMIYQSWSEALHFPIPPEPTPHRFPTQSAALIDDGETEAKTVIRGSDPLVLKSIKSASLIVEPTIDATKPVVARRYEFGAQSITLDASSRLLTISFPSLKVLALKNDLDRLRMKIEYNENYFDSPEENSVFEVAYANKKMEPTPGFTMLVTTHQIVANRDSKGLVFVRFEKPDVQSKKANTQIKFGVDGADFKVTGLSPLNSVPPASPPDPTLSQLVPAQNQPVPSKENVIPVDVLVMLELSNLSEATPVVISAQDVTDPKNVIKVKDITLRVERLQEPRMPEKESGK